MSEALGLSGYDLSDEGPGRTVNEDATLVREDLGLFAVADGAGGRGRGDVAANLALRTIENYIGSTVKSSHELADYDALGTPNQARRLSAAIHRAHGNIMEVLKKDKERAGMACTVVAILFAPRTMQLHIAHVGDSRCYRQRHGRLELLTQDHTIANEILERKPETPDEVLEQLPRNSVVCALGMEQELRVIVRTVDLSAGDRFLLTTDGLTAAVDSKSIWTTMRATDPPGMIASELLNHALAARTPDNVGLIVVDCREVVIDQEFDTRRYNEVPVKPPSEPTVEPSEGPSSAELEGPEIVDPSQFEVVEQWGGDSEFPTVPLDQADRRAILHQSREAPEFDLPTLERGRVGDADRESAVPSITDEDLEFEESEPLDLTAIPEPDSDAGKS